MAKNKQGSHTGGVENIESALSRTEQFLESNQKGVTTVFIIILVIVGGFLGFRKFYLVPKEQEAQEQIYMAERYFERDSVQLALDGDGNYLGFIDIIDEYKITKTGKLAKYYAGICYLKMGYYEDAIDYLKDFKTKSRVIGPIAKGAIGDAYVEMDELEEGLSYYMKAVELSDNQFTAPIYLLKAGKVLEELGEYKNALEVYQKIEKEYPNTQEGREVIKYIARVEVKLNS